MSISLSSSAWPSVPDDGHALLLVPVGSTEQHGPHLPFDTDTRVAVAVAAAAARGIAPERPVIVAPPITFGSSGEHQAFPGTLSIGTAALTEVLVELVRSATTWAGRVLLVNGHGGNLDALVAATRRLVHEGRDVAWVPALALPPGTYDAHAGRTETSLLLHLAPDTVDLTQVRRGATAPMTEILPTLRSAGVRVVSPGGVLGDPTRASAAEGANLFERAVAGVVRRAAAWTRDDAGRLTGPSPELVR